MSLSSESGFIEWADIRVDSLRMDNPRGQMESCVDFFVLFKETNEEGEPGVHISIPLDKAKELADGIYNHISTLDVDLISRSEAIKAIQKYGVGCLDPDDFSPEQSERFVINKLNELPSVTPQPRWIPVSERLPEIHQDVILSLRSLDIEVGFRAETEPYFYCHGADGCYIEPQNVLAWQPLPKPYNAESEG